MELSIQEISKSFGDKDVLKDINLEAKGGDIIGLIGKSGCGKSTLLKIIIGYYRQDKGKIKIDGKNITKDKIALRKLVGYTTQENSFYERLSVRENMEYYSKLYNVPRKKSVARIDTLLEQVGLTGTQHTLGHRISGGMKRRLDFAISLIHDPKILVLDEPTTGLDPLLIHQFWEIVTTVVKDEGKIVLVASHILSEVQKYCTQAAVLNKGSIVSIMSGQKMKNLEEEFRKLIT